MKIGICVSDDKGKKANIVVERIALLHRLRVAHFWFLIQISAILTDVSYGLLWQILEEDLKIGHDWFQSFPILNSQSSFCSTANNLCRWES